MSDKERPSDAKLAGGDIKPLDLKKLRKLDPEAFAETSFGSTKLPVGDKIDRKGTKVKKPRGKAGQTKRR